MIRSQALSVEIAYFWFSPEFRFSEDYGLEGFNECQGSLFVIGSDLCDLKTTLVVKNAILISLDDFRVFWIDSDIFWKNFLFFFGRIMICQFMVFSLEGLWFFWAIIIVPYCLPASTELINLRRTKNESQGQFKFITNGVKETYRQNLFHNCC